MPATDDASSIRRNSSGSTEDSVHKTASSAESSMDGPTRCGSFISKERVKDQGRSCETTQEPAGTLAAHRRNTLAGGKTPLAGPPRDKCCTGAEKDGEIIWVTWDSADDKSNPKNWSRGRKWLMCSTGIVFCGLVSMSVTGYAVAQESVSRELHSTSQVTILGLTLFTITFGSAPLVLAPFSEVYGRNGLYMVSAVVFALFFIPQAIAKNIETMLVARFISGIAGSTAVSLVGGTIADVWDREDLGLPMSLFAFAAFSTTGLGGMVFGYVEQYHDFRLISWVMFAVSALFTIAVLVLVRETRGSVLLSRKAARLRKETGSDRYQCEADAERDSIPLMVKTSLTRPIRLLFTEPVLAAFTAFISAIWGVLYILFQTLTTVFIQTYGFSTGQAAMAYTTQLVGSIIGLGIQVWGEKMYHKHAEARGPEARLYPAMIGGFLLPIGGFMYTWTSFGSIPWIVPCIGLTILYCGMYLQYLACFAYLADSYTLYASSALSAQSFMRNMVGAVFPFVAQVLYRDLGIQGAGSVASGLLTLFSATPFVLFFFGARLRASSKFAKELARLEAEGHSY